MKILKGVIPQKLQGRFEAWKQERAENKAKKIAGQSAQGNPDSLSKARIQQRDVKKGGVDESPAKIPASTQAPVSSSDLQPPPYQPENPGTLPPPYPPETPPPLYTRADQATFSQGDIELPPAYTAKGPDKKTKGVGEGIKRKLLGFIGNKALKKDDEGKKKLKEVKEEKESLKKELKQQEKALAKNEKAGHTSAELTEEVRKLELIRNRLMELEKEKQHIEQEDKAEGQSRKDLMEFLVDVATSQRDLYKERNLNATKKLYIPKLTVGSPNGPVELSEVSLTLKAPEFEPVDGKQWSPVFRIEGLEGKASIPVQGKPSLKARVVMEDIACTINAAWGKYLHKYITGGNGFTAAFNLPLFLGKLLTMPDDISIKGRSVSLQLLDSNAETLASLAEMPKKSPGSALDTLFETADFPFSLEVDQVSVATDGDLSTEATLTGPRVSYQPEKPDESKKKNNKLSFSATGGDVKVAKGSALAEKLLSELAIKNPFDALPKTSTSSSAATATDEHKPDMSKASESVTLSLEKINEVSVERELTESTPDHWHLTGVNHVKADIGSVTAKHEGLVGGEAGLYGLKLDGHVASNGQLNISADIGSGSLAIDAPEKLLPPEVGGNRFAVTGKAELNFNDLKLTANQSESTALTGDINVKTLTVENSDNTTIRVGDDGIKIPKGLKLKAQGTLARLEEDKLSINPVLHMEGASEVALIREGREVALPVKLDNAKEELDIEIPLNKQPGLERTASAPVVTGAGLNLNDLQVGPARVHELKVAMDKAHNGSLRVSAGLDLNDLMAKTQALNVKIPWYLKPLLRNKIAEISTQAEIDSGMCKLDGLRVATATFRPTENANLIDRLVTKAMNLCSGLVVHLLSGFKTGKHVVHTETGHAETKPHIDLKVGPVSRRFTLPLSEQCLDTSSNAIDIPQVLHETLGATTFTADQLAEVSGYIRDLRSDDSAQYSRAVDQLHRLMAADTARTGLIHWVANQWPLEPRQGSIDPECANKLIAVADIFASQPSLKVIALRLSETLGNTKGSRIQQMLEQPEGETDSMVRGLLYEMKGQRDDAIRCLREVIKSQQKNPQANAKLGCLLLNQLSENSSTRSKEDIVEAMAYLLAAAQEGQVMAIKTIERYADRSSMSIGKMPLISSVAQLYKAAMFFKTEKSYDDFSRALELLEGIPSTSEIHRDVVNLLAQRVHNGRHFFHTEDGEAFQRAEKEINDYLKNPEKAKGKKACELAVKLLYGASGAAAFTEDHLAHAELLLRRGLKEKKLDAEEQARARLHLEVIEIGKEKRAFRGSKAA